VNLRASDETGHNNDTPIATANDNGIETMPGFLYGNHAFVLCRMSTWIVGEE
jgi:hypothetical protein